MAAKSKKPNGRRGVGGGPAAGRGGGGGGGSTRTRSPKANAPAKKKSSRKKVPSAVSIAAKSKSAKGRKEPRGQVGVRARAPSRRRSRNASAAAKTRAPRQKVASVTPFEVHAGDLANLNEEQLKEFVKALLRCERPGASIDTGLAIFGDEMKAPDDGGDAVASTVIVSSDGTGSVEERTVWQLKAEKRPPTEAQLRKELRKPAVREVLRTGGKYVVVALQPNAAPAQREMQKKLRRLAKSDRASFVGQSELEQRARRFPSLARLVSYLRSSVDAFGALKAGLEWSIETPHTVEFEKADGRGELVAEIQAWLRSKADVQASLRVIGPPGVGKTRLVLEAIRMAGLLPITLYAQGRNAIPPALLAKIANTTDIRAVLVIDECRIGEMNEFVSSYGHVLDRIRLITIGHIEDEQRELYGPATRVIKLVPLGADAVSTIVRRFRSSITETRANWTAKKSGGYVKLALLLAESVAGDADTQLERLDEQAKVCEYLGRVLKTDKNLLLFKLMALFTKVGLSPPVGLQFEFLAKSLGVSPLEAGQVRGEAESRGLIARADPYCYVTPELLQDWLVIALLRDSYPEILALLRGASPDLLAQAAPRIARFVSERLPRAEQLAGDLLGTLPVFGEPSALKDRNSARAISRLARAAPSALAARLKEWLSTDEGKKLAAESESEFVYLLLELLWHPEFFDFAFSELVTLADVTPRQGIANDAKGALRSVFLVHLAPTLVDYSRRIAAARQVLAAASSTLRVLFLDSAAAALDVHETGIVAPIGRELGGSWKPQSREVEMGARRDALTLVLGALGDPEVSVRQKAADVLIHSFRSLLWLGMHVDAVAALRRLPLNTPGLREEVEHAIGFDAKRISPEALALVRQLYAELPTDLMAELRFAVGGWDALSDERTKLQLRKSHSVAELAAEVLRTKMLAEAVKLLVSDEAKNPGPVAYELGRLDSDLNVWPLFRISREAAKSAWVASIYLSGHLSGRPDKESFHAQLLASDDRFVVEAAVRAVPGYEPSLLLLQQVESLLRRGRVEAHWLAGIQLGRWSSRVNHDGFVSILRALAGSNDEGVRVALDAAQMAIHGEVELPSDVLLTLSIRGLDVAQRDLWRWAEVAKIATETHALEVGKSIIRATSHVSNLWLSDEIREVLTLAIKASGPVLARHALDATIADGKYDQRLVHVLGPEIVDVLGEEAVVDWAVDHGELGQAVLGEILPVSPTPPVFKAFQRFGIGSIFARAFAGAAQRATFWGPVSKHYEAEAEKFEQWASAEAASAPFRSWAGGLSKAYRERAKEELLGEQRDEKLKELDER